MKNFIKIFILTLIFNVSMIKAADFSATISGSTNVANGSTYTYEFKASPSNGVTIAGVSGVINYDKTKLELISASAVSPFDLTFNKSTASYTARYNDGKAKAFSYMKVKFKVKSMNVGDSTTISITNLKGTKVVNGSSSSATGSASKITLQVKSTNNNLSNLTVDSKTINGFKSSTTSYKMTVENSVSKVTIGATAADNTAKVSGTGTKNLSIYNNIIRVTVTSAAGKTKTYTITIVRKDADGYAGARSSDNKLKSLTIEGYEIPFDAATKEYELSVKNEVTKLNVEAIANDSDAKVEITNDPLVVGLNKIIIKVTAEDESTSEYVINVTRNNDNPAITIDKFKEVAETTTKDTIEVLVGNNDVITKENLQIIKDSKKNVIFAYYEENKLIYAWHLLNEDIKTDVDFSTKVSFESMNEERINKITNYAEAFYISSTNKNKSKAKLKVLTNLKGITKLYYFDGQIHLQSDRIEIDEDSYVEFPYEQNDYFLSRMEIVKNASGLAIILGVENAIIFGFCIYLIIKKTKEKKMMESKNEEV